MTRWCTRLFDIERDGAWAAGGRPWLSIRVQVPVEYKPRIDELLQKCYAKHNGHLTFSIELPHKSRSTGKFSQNAHLNGHVQQLCQHPPFKGWDFDDVKVLVKAKAVALGFPPPHEVRDGAGQLYRVFKSEADTNTEECSYLIEGAHLLAGEYGITLIEEKE